MAMPKLVRWLRSHGLMYAFISVALGDRPGNVLCS